MTQTLTDHDSIRRWAREHGARPALVKGTTRHNDANALQLAMEGTTQDGRLEPIDWDDWFQRFDESGLALMIDDSAASANKLVPRTATSAGRATTKRGAASNNTPAAATEDEDDDLFGDSEDELDDEFEEDEDDRD